MVVLLPRLLSSYTPQERPLQAGGQAYEHRTLLMGAILKWNPNTSSSVLLIYKYKGW